MAYVKLDCGILDSTLWINRDSRELFITALLMAEPREYDQTIPQWEVARLELTGYSAPPGWYGFVPAAGVGIIRRAGMDQQQGIVALERLGSAENDSRNPDFDGRRLIRIDGGYLILNYMRYRDKDHTAAERQRRLRERRKGANVTRDNNDVTRDVTLHTRDVTHADADADAKIKTKDKEAEKPRAARSAATRIPEDFSLTTERISYATEQGLEPGSVLEEFRDYWTAASGAKARKCDWDATWRTWCRRSTKDAAPRKTKFANAMEALRRA